MFFKNWSPRVDFYCAVIRIKPTKQNLIGFAATVIPVNDQAGRCLQKIVRRVARRSFRSSASRFVQSLRGPRLPSPPTRKTSRAKPAAAACDVREVEQKQQNSKKRARTESLTKLEPRTACATAMERAPTRSFIYLGFVLVVRRLWSKRTHGHALRTAVPELPRTYR